jgi:hypothetical protein
VGLPEFRGEGFQYCKLDRAMNIQPDELIDYEDVGLEIKSDEMLHS